MKTFRSYGESVLLGLAEIVIGIFLLANPVSASVMLVRVIGAIIIIMGVLNLIAYLANKKESGANQAALVGAVVPIVVGILIYLGARWIITTVAAFSVFIGILMLLGAISKAVQAFRLRKLEKGWIAYFLSAVLTILISLIIIANPFSTITILWSFIGFSLIAEGVIDMICIVKSGK